MAIALLFFAGCEKEKDNTKDTCDIEFKKETDYDVVTLAPKSSVDPSDSLKFTFHWGDGDSETNTTGEAIHQYDSLGTYEAFIVVQGPNCTKDIDCKIDLSPKNTCDLEMKLTVDADYVNVSSSPIDNSLSYTFHYEWGDGITDSDSLGTAEHVYNKAGTYTVILWYTASNGCTKEFIYEITIDDNTDDCNIELEAKQDVEWVTLVPKGNTPTNVTYNINWGDGSSNTVTTDINTATHEYANAGKYKCEVTMNTASCFQHLTFEYELNF